jgi:hypothetical protein
MPPDPAANFRIPIASICRSAPNGADCVNAAIAVLQQLRSAMLPTPYQLPGDFASLSPGEELLILINEDRIAYGLTPIIGLNTAADNGAQLAFSAPIDANGGDADPGYPPGLPSGWPLGGSNMAEDFPNVLYAYAFWMYDDGPNSRNLACTQQNPGGCWGHRHGMFYLPAAPYLILGAAVGTDTKNRPAYAMVVVLEETALPLEYTWNQALADGAGPAGTTTGTGPTGPERRTKYLVTVTLKPAGCGRVKPGVIDSGFAGETIYLTAVAGSRCRFIAWLGASGCAKNPTCAFKMTQDLAATVVFAKKSPKS